MGLNNNFMLAFLTSLALCSNAVFSSPQVETQMLAGASMKLHDQNVTLKGPNERIPHLDIRNCTVRQSGQELWCLANSINITKSTINIVKNQTFGLDALSINISNSTLNFTRNAKLIVSGNRVTFKNNMLYHIGHEVLRASKSKIRHAHFIGNNFTNASVRVLKLADELWSFVNNTFTCACPSTTARPLREADAGEINFCNVGGCVVTHTRYVQALNQQSICANGNDVIDVDALCS